MKKFRYLAGILAVCAIIGGVLLAGRGYMESLAAEEAQEAQEELAAKEPEDLSGWSLDESGWHYRDEKGRPVQNAWVSLKDAEVYLTENGAMATGWCQVEADSYYMDPAGRKTTGWHTEQDQQYYFSPDSGTMAKGWQDLETGRYHFSDAGVMEHGWLDADGQRYFLSGDGIMQTGWILDSDRRYYLNQDGHMQIGWLDLEGSRYYFQPDGILTIGLAGVDGANYYFDDSGARQTGWQEINDSRYYFNEDGVMYTGWLESDGRKYYLDADGAMLKGWKNIDGQNLCFDGNGVYQEGAVLPDEGAGPMIAMTFDDGPGKYTDRLLNAIEASHAKATFFMLGSLVNTYPDAVKRMKSMGCEIGNHSYSHARLTALDAAGVQDEINRTNDNLVSIIGEGATVIRPPYGSYDDMVKQNTGEPLVLWSIDTLDWKTLNTQSTVDCVLNQVRDGDIILMHDIHETSVAAAETLIPELIRRGYQLVTVSELAAAKGRSLQAGTSYGSFH